MAYYMSYIEINGHSALMLSEQKDPTKPSKIICELGFAYASDIPQNSVGYFTRHRGQVRQETNASRALYSSTAKVKHVTYEISELEMEKFFSILNRDRRINAPEIKSVSEDKAIKQVEVVGGPDYQKINNNCKTYVMGVLKEIGIVDASKLSNSFIQRTGTSNSLLKNVSKEELTCPIKEELLEAVTPLVTDLNRQLKSLIKDIDINKLETEIANPEALDADQVKTNTLKKELYDNVNKAINTANTINENKHKIGVMLGITRKFDDLNNSLVKIASLKESAKILATNENNETSFLDILNGLSAASNKLVAMRETAIKVTKLSDEGRLEFFWRTSPPLSQRLSLNNFSPEEQAVYATKIKSKEIVEGLDHILDMIDINLQKATSLADSLHSDMASLRKLVDDIKKDINESDVSFVQSIEKSDKKNIASTCLERQEYLNKTLENLEKNLSSFQPTSKKETPTLIRYINRILSYLKKDYFVLDNSAKDILTRKTSAIRQAANQHAFNKTNLENKHSQKVSDPSGELKSHRLR